MTAARHLPSGADQVAYQQGWNDDSLVIHLAGFIASKGLDAEFTQYLADCAAEEESELAQMSAESDEDGEDDERDEAEG